MDLDDSYVTFDVDQLAAAVGRMNQQSYDEHEQQSVVAAAAGGSGGEEEEEEKQEANGDADAVLSPCLSPSYDALSSDDIDLSAVDGSDEEAELDEEQVEEKQPGALSSPSSSSVGSSIMPGAPNSKGASQISSPCTVAARALSQMASSTINSAVVEETNSSSSSGSSDIGGSIPSAVECKEDPLNLNSSSPNTEDFHSSSTYKSAAVQVVAEELAGTASVSISSSSTIPSQPSSSPLVFESSSLMQSSSSPLLVASSSSSSSLLPIPSSSSLAIPSRPSDIGLCCLVCLEAFSSDESDPADSCEEDHRPRMLSCAHAICTDCCKAVVGDERSNVIRCPIGCGSANTSEMEAVVANIHQLPPLHYGIMHALKKLSEIEEFRMAQVQTANGVGGSSSNSLSIKEESKEQGENDCAECTLDAIWYCTRCDANLCDTHANSKLQQKHHQWNLILPIANKVEYMAEHTPLVKDLKSASLKSARFI